MKTRILLFLAALLGGAAVWMFWPRELDVKPGAVTAISTPLPAALGVTEARPEKPAAMSNAATYAATRLKEIKAEPNKWKDPWVWRQEFAAADTPELQREVLGLAKQLGVDSLLAVLPPALASSDDEVRLDAARSIALLPENRLRDGFAAGVAAADPEIRQEVMELILQVQPHLRADLLQAALSASAPDVQARAVETITDLPSPAHFTVLLEGLRTTSPEVRPKVNEAIEGMVQQQFQSYDEAARWWKENREHYDALMSRIDGN